MQNNGLRSYLYEYIFFRSIETIKDDLDQPVMISAARGLRDQVDAVMTARSGGGLHDPQASVNIYLQVLDEVLDESVAGYRSLFRHPDGSRTSAYSQMYSDFIGLTGVSMPGQPAPRVDAAGARLPISPYDPRYAGRSSVKSAGSNLLFVRSEDVELFAGGDPAAVAGLRSGVVELNFFVVDQQQGLMPIGEVYSLADASGMSELMSRMTERDYRKVSDWVMEHARSGGTYDRDQFMSPAAVHRAAAILDDLRAAGVPYSIRKDKNPGQIKARIDGTRIDVRLTDSRAEENFVGRVYDNGVSMYFSSDITLPGSSNRKMLYTPTVADTVNLVRFAQGMPVQRTDGVGLVGVAGTRRNSRGQLVNDSYRSADYAPAVYGDYPGQDGKVIIQRNTSDRTASAEFFATSEAGEAFLREAIETSRANLSAAVDAEGVIAQAEEHAAQVEAGSYSPVFHGDPAVAAIQRSYWDVLVGNTSDLLLPGISEQEYAQRLESIGDMALGQDEAVAAHQMLMDGLVYAGADAAAKVRSHAADVPDRVVGRYESHRVLDVASEAFVDATFDPVVVATYMTSSYGQFRNNDDLVAAMRAAGTDPDLLMGSSFYTGRVKDRLISFDEASARPMEDSDQEFIASMGQVVRGALERNGVQVSSIMIDDAGIVQYAGSRQTSLLAKEGSVRQLTGQIGQIFAPGQEYGQITTKFGSGQDYMFVPGYEATIMTQRPGESKSLEERTLLLGYEQIMTRRIRSTITSDLLSSMKRPSYGEPTNLNGVYRSLYETRHAPDFLEASAQEGMSDDLRDAILRTEGRRVRYGNEVRDGSTINAQYRAENAFGEADLSNDNYADPYLLTGQRNMSLLTPEGDGFFDPVMTSGSTNQGIVRFLTQDAKVNPDGTITPGDPSSRAPLMNHEIARYMDFNPADRNQMSTSNVMQAAAVTPPARTAMMTFGGWNFDDPMIVSKEFAAQYQIRGADGAMRDLVVGDKLSDLNGNKGVISLVVDRDMDLAQAEEQGLQAAVEWFVANPDLEVVMSPFSPPSRFNGGSARELMSSPVDLNAPDGGRIAGGTGLMRFIVTHLAVDSKTTVYDEEALAAGRGRKASSQLAWALQSQGADAVLAECYGMNTTAATNMREYLNVCGLDMFADGTLHQGRQSHDMDDERAMIAAPELVWRTNKTGRRSLDAAAMKKSFGALIGEAGGDLEIPFPLTFPTGELTPVLGSDEQGEPTSWGLPVLSSHLRCGQDLQDGSSTVHDYTNHYLDVYEECIRYRAAREQLESSDVDPNKIAAHQEVIAKAPQRAQMAFDAITRDVSARRFGGKHNVVRDQVMASRMPSSATAVWSTDPRLELDQVSMGPAMAQSLGLGVDDHVLIWRDPMLRDAGVRYMRVAIDDRLTGVAINPVMDKCFDGDFDGDSVAVVKLNTPAAQREASRLLSVPANLLDKGQVDRQLTDQMVAQGRWPADAPPLRPLLMQDSLDVKASQYRCDHLIESFTTLMLEANETAVARSSGQITQQEALRRDAETLGGLNDYYHDAMETQFGQAHLRFGSVQEHMDSVLSACVETGAKGSESKVLSYGRYLGVQAQERDDFDPEHDPVSSKYVFTDTGVTAHTRDDDVAVQYAQAVKSFGTGIAGKFSQRGVKALRNEAITSVLELTYPVTQSILQSKHDPQAARRKYEVLSGPAHDLWRGRALVSAQRDGHTVWEPLRDERGQMVQADSATWCRQFEQLYTHADGLNVDIDPSHIQVVAAALTGPDGRVVDIEEEPAPGRQQLASPMDRLAYDGSFEVLVELASNNENLYAGSNSAQFAPFTVRSNKAAMDTYEQQLGAGVQQVAEPQLTALVTKDVQEGYVHRAAGSQHARTAGRRRAPLAAPVPQVEPDYTPVQDDPEGMSF